MIKGAKSFLFGLLFVLMVSLLVSCNDDVLKDEVIDGPIFSETAVLGDKEIVLGEKIPNPFSLAGERAKALADGTEVEANYYYFRVRVQDKDVAGEAMKWLNDKFGDLETVPMDREILEGGYYYKDPELDEDDIPWLYFMESTEDYQYVLNNDFNLVVEELDSMWIDPEIVEALMTNDIELLEQNETMQALAAQYYGEEQEDESKGLFSRLFKALNIGVTKSPSGTIKYKNVLSGKEEPLANVKVISRQLILETSAMTNADGYFKIPNSYNSLIGSVNIKLVFENDKCILNGYGEWAQYVLSAYYAAGSYSVKNTAGMTINISSSKRANDLANVLSGVNDYHDFCSEFGITKPKQVRIWMLKDNPAGNDGSAVTLMARYSSAALSFYSTLIGPALSASPTAATMFITAGALVGSLRWFFPDIVLTGKTVNEKYLEILFHELGHASHATCVGNNYWINEYLQMIASLPGYPTNSRLVDFVESWGYFAGPYCLAWDYERKGIKTSTTNILNDYDTKNFSRKPQNSNLYSKNFNAQGYYYLVNDKGNCYKQDYIFADKYTVKDIFEVYKDNTVKSLDAFIDKLATKKKNNSVERTTLDATIYGKKLNSSLLLSFNTKDNSANAYIVKGFSKNETKHTWTLGKQAEMKFKFTGSYGDIRISMDYRTYDGNQRVKIYANNNLITSYTANGTQTREIKIPKSCVKNGELVLRFDLPDAHSPKSVGKSSDARELALGFTAMTLIW